MATLTLDRVWINLIPSGESVNGWAAPVRSETFEVPGDIRRYAGGRERATRLRGMTESKQFAMQRLSTVDKDTLKSWAGRHVQVRDLSGKWLGTFFAGGVDRNMDGSWDLAFTLTAVTTVEGV
jgi:hypothetical protein